MTSCTPPEPPGKTINFARGHPNDSLLPLQEMRSLLVQIASKDHHKDLQTSMQYLKSDSGDPRMINELRSFFQHHTKNDSLGNPPIELIPNKYSTTMNTDWFVTHGVSHGLDILCTTQTQAGDLVLVERPTYFLGCDIFKSHGLIVQSLPMKDSNSDNGNGVDVDRLEAMLEHNEFPVRPRMIYIIPTHQNPTGRTMPIQDRWKLATLARKYGILIVADEVYHLLDWRDDTIHGPRPARMAVLDAHINAAVDNPSDGRRIGCCVSVSSFTKIFTPGVRCGWVEGPKEIIDSLVNLGYIQSQGGCAPFMGELFREALSQGISDRVLTQLIDAYKDRSEQLCQILQSEPGVELDSVPLGGYFCSIRFQGVDDTSAFAEYCLERGIKIMPGKRCDFHQHDDGKQSGLQPDACSSRVRLCFADLDVSDLEEGARKLVTCYNEYLK